MKEGLRQMSETCIEDFGGGGGEGKGETRSTAMGRWWFLEKRIHGGRRSL